MGWFSKRTPVQEFWRWFVKNEPRLRAADVEDTSAPQEVGEQLKKVHPSLVWEWGDAKDGKRELVLSADGLREAVAPVEALADAAPALEGWRVIRFRPRLAGFAEGRLVYAGVDFHPAEIQCALARDGALIGIVMLVPQLSPESERACKGASFILLDMALGEYDMIMRVGFVDVLPMDADVRESVRFPFEELRERFDQLAEEMLAGAKD